MGHQLIHDYPHGVWFISLDSLSNPSRVPHTVASVFDIREGANRPVIDVLKDVLHRKTALLFLDNCENLPDACVHLIKDLIEHCPHLRILTTCRELLKMESEATYYLPSLSTPKRNIPLEKIAKYESVQFFIERAALVLTTFQLTRENAQFMVDICGRVDGIPLAIELTAARANILTVEEISEQLHNSFAILASDNRTTVSRHQTLQASMDWIWSLLTDSEQVYLQHLSVFAGGWTLEAAEVICDGDANEAISISRELGDLRGAIGQLEALAHAEVLHEEFATAQRHLKDGIQIWVLYSLEGLADLFTRTLQYESAACLIGFADATRERSNEPREPITEADVDKVIFAVKEKIGSSMFELAYISGRGMTMDEAVALALREQQPISTNN